MNLKSRIKLYLIGLGLGIVLSFAFFGSRDWLGWTPGRRVLDRLVATYVPDSAGICLLDCHDISHHDLEALLGNGKVDFEKSETRKKPLFYMVVAKEKKFSIMFRAEDTTAYIDRILTPGTKNCPCLGSAP